MPTQRLEQTALSPHIIRNEEHLSSSPGTANDQDWNALCFMDRVCVCNEGSCQWMGKSGEESQMHEIY